MTRPTWQALALASSLVLFGTALAADRPISAVKLVLKRSANGAQRLTFVSKDPSALMPAIGTADDPAAGSPGGALIEVFSAATPGGAVLSAPKASAWKARDAAHDSFRFVNRAAPNALSAVRGIVLRQGRSIAVQARQTGLALAGSQGTVGIRITTGTVRNCSLFAGAAVRKDRTGVFMGRNALASALAGCSDALLTGATTTTSISSTTMPGLCGDGVINQSSEECDGTDLGLNAFPWVSCGLPGFSNACQACSDHSQFAILPCCNPSSTVIGYMYGADCVPLRCDPPFTCEGNVCQDDHSCCTSAGTTCALSSPGFSSFPPPPLVPCCPGLACGHIVPGGAVCCVPDTATCTQDTDCCSGHCGVSGTCDVCDYPATQAAYGFCCSIFGACTRDSDCCSTHCGVSGTCDLPG